MQFTLGLPAQPLRWIEPDAFVVQAHSTDLARADAPMEEAPHIACPQIRICTYTYHWAPSSQRASRMGHQRKSWSQKLDDAKDLPQVVDVPQGTPSLPSGGTLLIPSPRLVDAAIRTIPPGQTRTASELRQQLAFAHQAQACCPLVTGIFCNIAAHASEERTAAGSQDSTPWWRVLTKEGKPNPRFPGAPTEQIRRLAAEGVQLPDPVHGRRTTHPRK